MNAIERLYPQLRDSTMSPLDIANCLERYERALSTATPSDWEGFYRGLHAAMHRLTPARGEDAGRESAIASLFLILEDDLGVELFDRAELAQLRYELTATAARVSVG